MRPEELRPRIEELTLMSHVPDEYVAQYFSKYPSFDLDDDRHFYLLAHDREFLDREHIVGFHGRCNPPIPLLIYHYVVLNYCYSGQITFDVGSEVITLQEGDCLITDRHAPHGVHRTGEHDYGVTLVLSDDYFGHLPAAGLVQLGTISPFARQIGTQGAPHVGHMVFRSAGDGFVRELIDRILCEHFEPMQLSADVIDGLIGLLLIQLFRTYSSDLRVSEEDDRRAQLTGEIREWVVMNYQSGTLTQMARDLGYETTYLSSLVRKTCNKTFRQLVNAERMRQASVLLVHTQLPVYEIAQKVGISNLTSFYKRFAEFAGCTPAEYRTLSTG